MGAVDWDQRLKHFWKRMAKLRHLTEVPYLACDVCHIPKTKGCHYAVIEHTKRRTRLKFVGWCEDNTTGAEFAALLKTCELADEKSVVISDHCNQVVGYVNAFHEIRTTIKDLADKKSLVFTARPSFVHTATTSSGHWNPLDKLRYQLYSRAHMGARLVAEGIITAADAGDVLPTVSKSIAKKISHPRAEILVHHWLQRCAYELWELDGSPESDGKKYWFQAVELLEMDLEHFHLGPHWIILSHRDPVTGFIRPEEVCLA